MARPDDKVEFEVGFDLKKHLLSAKVKLPKLPKLKLRASRAREIGWLTATLANMQATGEGKRDGKQNVPGLNAAPFTAPKEIGILNKRAYRIDPVANYIGRLVEIFLGYVNDHKPQAVFSANMQTAIEARRTAIEAELQANIVDQEKALQNAALDLEKFKKEHAARIGPRNAKYPDLTLIPIATSLAFFLVDGLLNATFFQGASQSGFVGGMVIAFGLSAINISLGIVAGLYGLREVSHITEWRRRVGWSVLGALCGLGLLLNFSIAHFRFVAEEQIQNIRPGARPVSIENMALDQVFDHLFSNPFSLGNLPAALLLCSGMGVFFLGLLEGWQGFADKYPGYRTVDHEVKKASRKLENTYRTLRLVLNTLYSSSEIRAKISKRVHDFLKDQIERGRAALNRETDAASRYESRVSDHARRLLAKYQQGNRSIRGNRRKREKLGLDEVPSYFGGPMPPFEKRFTGNPRITEGHTQAADALTLLHVNVQQLDAFLKWLSTEQKENAEKNTQKEHKQGTAQ